jgi:hypothetical protein
MIDLDVDTPSEAEHFLGRMHEIWQLTQVASAMRGNPHVRIVETVKCEDL